MVKRLLRSLIILITFIMFGCQSNINIMPIQNQTVFKHFSDNTSNKLLADKDEIFPELYDMLDSAQASIQISIFIYGGKIGQTISEKLIKKQKQGVKIQFITDKGLGTIKKVKEDMITTLNFLTKNGVDVRLFPVEKLPKGPGWLSNIGIIYHSKIVVIDGKSALIGGMNFNEMESINHDYMVKINGDVAAALGNLVNEDWQISTSYNNSVKKQNINLHFNTSTNSDIVAETGIKLQNIRKMIVPAFKNAKTSIYVEQLFIDDQESISALIGAKQRGVDVKVILNCLEYGKHLFEFLDKLPIKGAPNYNAINKLLSANIPVKWFVPQTKDQMLHAKAQLIDGEYMIIGSANMTYRAFDKNREVVVSILDKAIGHRFTTIFLNDWQNHGKEIISLTKWEKFLAWCFDKATQGLYGRNEFTEEDFEELIRGKEPKDFE